MIESPARPQLLRPVGRDLLGDLLALAVDIDDSVRRLKGLREAVELGTGALKRIGCAELCGLCHALWRGDRRRT